MPSYQTVDPEYTILLERVKQDYHPHLIEADVTVALLKAHGKRNATGELTGPTLKAHGYPAIAMVKVNNQRDRTEGKKDATIVVDGDQFFYLPEEEQIAVLDHELEHIEIVKDDEGAIQLDDSNRPRLKLKIHDMFMGGFSSVVARHGRRAVEVRHVEEVVRVVEEMMAGRGM